MKKKLKKALVTVPVKLNIWIRPECQRRQFEVIKKVRPSILFLISDGGKNEEEWKIIKKHRHMFDTEIDWNCKVYRLYEEVNNGLYGLAEKRNSLIWDNVDRCIFLEDDHIPSVSYFQFCAEMLEKYKDDERIHCICGINHLGIYDDVNSDYFFSRQGSIWGYATWKREYLKYNDFEYAKDDYIMRLLMQRTRHNHLFWNRLKGYSKNKYYEGHVASTEFFIEFAMYAQNQLQIIPKKNMIKNIGCDEKSTHSDSLRLLPRGIRKVFNMDIYEMNFPLVHPKYVIPDIYYEKKRNRIMGYNYKLVQYYRLIERGVLKLRYGQFKSLFFKLKNKIFKENEK